MIILNSLLLLLLLFVFIIQAKRQSHLSAKSPVHVYLYSIGRFESCSVLMWSMYKSIAVKRLAKINCRSFKRNKVNRFPLFYGSWGDPVYCSLTNWHNKSVKTAVATCNKKPPWWEVYRHVIRQSLNENKNHFRMNIYIYISRLVHSNYYIKHYVYLWQSECTKKGKKCQLWTSGQKLYYPIDCSIREAWWRTSI